PHVGLGTYADAGIDDVGAGIQDTGWPVPVDIDRRAKIARCVYPTAVLDVDNIIGARGKLREEFLDRGRFIAVTGRLLGKLGNPRVVIRISTAPCIVPVVGKQQE